MKEADKAASANTQIIGDWGEHYLGFIHGAEWADSHPHWISVEDKFPPMRDEDGMSDIVLTHSKGGGIYHNRYNYGHNTWDNPYVYNVTHWMPLPEAPVVTDLNKKDLPPVSCQEGDILVTEEGGEE